MRNYYNINEKLLQWLIDDLARKRLKEIESKIKSKVGDTNVKD